MRLASGGFLELVRLCAARGLHLPRARPPMRGSRVASQPFLCVNPGVLPGRSRGREGPAAFVRKFRGSDSRKSAKCIIVTVIFRQRALKGAQRSSKEWIGNSPDLHNARSKACMLGSLAELRRADDTCRAKTGIGGSGFAHGAVCVACSPARPGSCISRLRRRPCWRARSFARATGSVHAVGCCGRFRSARKKAAAFRRPPSCVDVIDPMSLCDR